MFLFSPLLVLPFLLKPFTNSTILTSTNPRKSTACLHSCPVLKSFSCISCINFKAPVDEESLCMMQLMASVLLLILKVLFLCSYFSDSSTWKNTTRSCTRTWTTCWCRSCSSISSDEASDASSLRYFIPLLVTLISDKSSVLVSPNTVKGCHYTSKGFLYC